MQLELTNRRGDVVGHALIDDEDSEQTLFQWRLGSKGYAVRGCRIDGKYKQIALHIEIMQPPTGMLVDHESRDKLDCRRSNLRIVTRAQQNQNRPSHGKTSQHRGVCWDKHRKKWHASVRLNGERVYSEFFVNEKTAGLAARVARDRLMTHNNEVG